MTISIHPTILRGLLKYVMDFKSPIEDQGTTMNVGNNSNNNNTRPLSQPKTPSPIRNQNFTSPAKNPSQSTSPASNNAQLYPKNLRNNDGILLAASLPTWGDYARVKPFDPQNFDSPKSLTLKESQVRSEFNEKISLWSGNIAKDIAADYIVNAGNPGMNNGGGVTGAIFDACQDSSRINPLEQYILTNIKRGNQKANPLETDGSLEVTETYGDLEKRADTIFHVAGPQIQDADKLKWRKEKKFLHPYSDRLRKTYDAIFKAFGGRLGGFNNDDDPASIVIPPISTGIYNFPLHLGVKIQVEKTREFLERMEKENKLQLINKIVFCYLPNNEKDDLNYKKTYRHFLFNYFPVK